MFPRPRQIRHPPPHTSLTQSVAPCGLAQTFRGAIGCVTRRCVTPFPLHTRCTHSARYTTWMDIRSCPLCGARVCAAVGCAATSGHFQMSTVIRLSMRRPAMTLLGRRACSSSSSSSPSAPPRNPNVIPPGMGSGRDGNPIPGEIAGGPKPVVYRSFVLNSKVCASAPTHSDMCFSAMLASTLFRSCKFAFLNRRCLAFYWMLILTLRAMCSCLQMVWFYSFLFVVPTGLAFMLTGGRTQLDREALLNSEAARTKLRENFGDEAEERQKEMKAAMNKVLFEQRDDWSDMRTEWAKKRDAKRARERAEREAAANAK